MADSSAPDIMLPATEALQNDKQMKLLNAVDAIRALGVDGIVALPQLVVCGDQSSGKSSVLEAISGIPFPKKIGVCTKFATEVILRRDPSIHMSVSIVPSVDCSALDRERISGFRRELTSINDFESLFEEAKKTMGISDQSKNFSKDVLRVELWGPTQPQLTLVDLPGLFHAETKGQSIQDIKLVDDLVASYIKNDRSIILAIISANYDPNLQAVLTRARKVDPEGKRTLGIITKPDTLTTDDEKRVYLKIARNEDVKFDLGWHVVRNKATGMDNSQKESRDELETEFFSTSPIFSTLPKNHVGIGSLRTSLSNILFEQVKKELPGVINDIMAKLEGTRAAIRKLGPARSSLSDQKTFLIELGESFHSICRDAVAGHYDHDFFREDDSGKRRLCAILMNKHYSFAGKLRKNGASWKIIQEDDEQSDMNSVDSDEFEDFTDEERSRSRKDAIEEACKVLKRNRGRELPGLPNPLLVGELFREYSRPWAGIARAHIKDIWDTTRIFLADVLQHLTDRDVCEKIDRHWLDKIMDKSFKLANEKLEELLEVHKDHPLTTNDDFVTNRVKIQGERAQSDLQLNMDMVAAEDAFDNMNAYYKVALNLFMDNVPSLAIQSPIVRKLPSMFSPSTVMRMDEETIRKIAGESDGKVRNRERTLRELTQLEEGAQICKAHALWSIPTPRLVARSDSLATEYSSVGGRTEKPRSRSTSRRLHSPSVSEDGRATSRANGQKINPTTSPAFGNNLAVPGDNPIWRPASTSPGSLFSTTPTPSINQNVPSNSVFNGFGNSPSVNLFGSPLPHPTASSTEGSTGTGRFSFGNIPKTQPTSSGQPDTSSTPLFGSLSSNSRFPNSTASATSKQGAKALPKNDYSNPPRIEEQTQASMFPRTHEHSPHGFQPYHHEHRNLHDGDQVDLFQSNVNLPGLKFPFEELHLADQPSDDAEEEL